MRRVAALLVLSASLAMNAAATGESARQAELRATVDAMLAEPLAEASPAGLRMANTMLGKAFNRGVDDLDSYVYLLKLAIQHALALAERHPRQAAQYQGAAVAMTYNLAANTWIGWGPGEVGDVAEAHRRLGLQAARMNIDLASQLGLGPERRRNGYWVLGAHLLAAGNYRQAADAFATSRELGTEAKIETAAQMAQGWIHIANILAGERQERQLAEVIERLRGMGKDGVFYADQYEVALAVFGSTDSRNRGPARP